MKFNPPNYWLKKQEKKEIFLYGMSEQDIAKLSKEVMKKLRKHDDETSMTEFLQEHPEFRNLLWKEQKKLFKKRYPYLTDKELEFMGKVGEYI